MNNKERVERLEIDLDSRLRWLLDTIFEVGDCTQDQAAAFARAAYAQGYVDGQKEKYGRLNKDNGFAIPELDMSKRGELTSE